MECDDICSVSQKVIIWKSLLFFPRNLSSFPDGISSSSMKSLDDKVSRGEMVHLTITIQRRKVEAKIFQGKKQHKMVIQSIGRNEENQKWQLRNLTQQTHKYIFFLSSLSLFKDIKLYKVIIITILLGLLNIQAICKAIITQKVEEVIQQYRSNVSIPHWNQYKSKVDE